jgi:hypothetical protein
MEKNTGTLVIAFIGLSLLVGVLLGSILIPTEKEVQVPFEVVKEVPVEVPVEVEVIKEVQVEKNFEDYKAEAVELCLEEFLDDADLDRYQDAEIRDISDEWNIVFDTRRDEDRTTITIDEIKFRVFDTLDETRSTVTKSCKVVYYDDEVKTTLA